MHVFIPDDDDVWSRALVVDERAGLADEGRVFTLQREPLGVHAADPASRARPDPAKFELTEARLRAAGNGELALQNTSLSRSEGAQDM